MRSIDWCVVWQFVAINVVTHIAFRCFWKMFDYRRVPPPGEG
jgi:hypothetical protein